MKLTVNAAGFNNSVQMGTKDGQSVRTVKKRSVRRRDKARGRSSGKAQGGSETAGVEGCGKCMEK
ncbi:MAG: hypothetical protein ACLTIG_07820 [Roseburia hominis]